jgi:transcriptional regulator GlxA family with amidase domain
MGKTTRPGLHVSLVAIPDAVLSTLGGVFDVLGSVQQVAALSDAVPAVAPFEVEIVGEGHGPVELASGVPISTHRAVAELPRTDIVIVPSIRLANEGWEKGRYPQLIGWLRQMHAQGATLCSACSGVFLIAETGLLDGKETAVHWPYARAFRQAFPAVAVHPDRALLTWGEHDEYVSSGASSSWHDLVLYLIARYVNPAAAQAVAQYFALQWHRDGLAPYVIFHVPSDHGDALIVDAQQWLDTHFAIAGPVDEMVRRSGVPERSFKRRFTKATGFTPIAYVQRLRIEDAKRRLERTDEPIDEISWRVGYEDPAFFRRLFKRTTGIAPGAYRRKFEIPGFATPR